MDSNCARLNVQSNRQDENERAPVHVTNTTLNITQSAGCLAKAFFLLTKDAPPCYLGMNSSVRGRFADDDEAITSSLQLAGPMMAQHLSPAQRSLVDLMHVHQFGRIENMLVRAGEPILTSDVKVVRVARLGGTSDAARITSTVEFELKRHVRDLFEELERLHDGTVISLEFRHGLPFLLETTAHFIADS
jgi:hypothetical protein